MDTIEKINFTTYTDFDLVVAEQSINSDSYPANISACTGEIDRRKRLGLWYSSGQISEGAPTVGKGAMSLLILFATLTFLIPTKDLSVRVGAGAMIILGVILWLKWPAYKHVSVEGLGLRISNASEDKNSELVVWSNISQIIPFYYGRGRNRFCEIRTHNACSFGKKAQFKMRRYLGQLDKHPDLAYLREKAISANSGQ